MDLAGRVALVTGASRGIGRDIALLLARNGADVAVNYNASEQAAAEIESEIVKLGRKAMRIKCSVGDYEAAQKMAAAVKNELGPVDILVNNAGILHDKFFINMEPEDWTDVIQTNLIGIFNVTKLIAFSMVRRGKGRIVNLASLSAMVGVPGQTNYTAAKAGVIGFTKSLSRELAPFGITVNAVAPGYIDTDMLKGMPEQVLSRYRELIPLGRLGSAEEVAQLVVFLASDKSSYITGQVIRVDGGLY
ncbi:MAG: 3-oxoacyl-[acyl-carrier-protein] reductase [Candidatus Eisenbacteria bacterium]